MNVDEKLNVLKSINKVPAPLTLFIKINQELQVHDNTDVSRWNWMAIAASLAFLLILNGTILYKFNSGPRGVIVDNTELSNLSHFSKAMHLASKIDINYE